MYSVTRYISIKCMRSQLMVADALIKTDLNRNLKVITFFIAF